MIDWVLSVSQAKARVLWTHKGGRFRGDEWHPPKGVLYLKAMREYKLFFWKPLEYTIMKDTNGIDLDRLHASITQDM